jgi:hypothetical protein
MARFRFAQGDDDRPVFGGASSDDDDRDSERTPLGVPEGFRAPAVRTAESFRGMGARAAEGWASQGAGVGSVVERGPRYFEGDQFRPQSLHPADILTLQANMAAAGMLTDFKHGQWDKNSIEAYTLLLTQANAAGMTWEMMLQQNIQAASALGSTGGGSSSEGGGGGGSWQIDPETGEPVWVPEQYVPPPLEIRTTNKDDLRRLFRETIINTMGEGWSREQIDELVDAYNWKEIAVQQEAYNKRVELERDEFMGERTEGGEMLVNATPDSLDIASPETFLDERLREEHPDEWSAGQLINEVIPDFMNMLGGWTGGGG